MNHQTVASSIRIKLAFFPWWNPMISGEISSLLVKSVKSMGFHRCFGWRTPPFVRRRHRHRLWSPPEIRCKLTASRRFVVRRRWRRIEGGGKSWEGDVWVCHGLSENGLYHDIPIKLPSGYLTIFNIAMENHGKSPCLIGKPSINGSFSMAMLNNQRVYKIAIS